MTTETTTPPPDDIDTKTAIARIETSIILIRRDLDQLRDVLAELAGRDLNTFERDDVDSIATAMEWLAKKAGCFDELCGYMDALRRASSPGPETASGEPERDERD